VNKPIIGASMFFQSSDKSRFFDRPEVLARIGKGKVKALNKAGGACRKTIQQGMRRATSDKPSKPGSPPKQRRAGDDGLRKIMYSLQPDGDTVKLTVVKWNGAKGGANPPQLHEFGGMAGKATWRLSPTGETRWMFEPENAAKYVGLQKMIRKWDRYKDKRKMKIGKGKNAKTISDFGLRTEFRQAVYPKRSFMQSGADKYAQSKHFERVVAELLKG